MVDVEDLRYHGDPEDVFVALVDLLERPAWRADALCVEHPQVNWFPGRGESLVAARAVCARCAVSVECLTFALAQEVNPEGVWAGTSQRERIRLRRTAA